MLHQFACRILIENSNNIVCALKTFFLEKRLKMLLFGMFVDNITGVTVVSNYSQRLDHVTNRPHKTPRYEKNER